MERVLVLLLVLEPVTAMVRQMTIAAIFDQESDTKYHLAFAHAVESINRNR